jgi:hypothetical protein
MDNVTDTGVFHMIKNVCVLLQAETPSSSSLWFRVLQYHCHSLGHWRRRRNALANIMIDGMGIEKNH